MVWGGNFHIFMRFHPVTWVKNTGITRAIPLKYQPRQ